MAMKTSSRKAKGRRLQGEIVQTILKHIPSLGQMDVRPAIMGESGVDIKLSTEGVRLFPFSVEAKNHEKINIWKSISQSESNSIPNTTPLLVFRKNNSKTYCVLGFETLMNIIYSGGGCEETRQD